MLQINTKQEAVERSCSQMERSGIHASSDIAVKCHQCKAMLYKRDCQRNLNICPLCDYHFRLTASERIQQLLDPGSFIEEARDIQPVDALHFTSRAQSYAEKLAKEQLKTGQNEAVSIGRGCIEHIPLALAVMDFAFIGGSMGAAVGEKITRAIEIAIQQQMPLLIVSASGGARMQEGIYSLMQMAKTAAALVKLAEARLPYMSVLTDPTTGGVTASFAMLGDVIIAEPGCLICLSGPRVIEQALHIRLPSGAVTAEFVHQHGFVDAIVHRRDLRKALARLLHFYTTARRPLHKEVRYAL